MKRSILALPFLLWMGIIVTTYYVVQKPGLLHAFRGLADTLWTLIVAGLLLFNAYGLGMRILSWLGPKSIDPVDHLLFSSGIGLGVLGLLGLGFSAAQLAHEMLLSTFQFGLALIFLLTDHARKLGNDIKALTAHWHLSFSQYDFFSKLAIVLPFLFSFLLTLVPPFEAFDALLYHLAQPARILQAGGLKAIDIAPFWFPSLSQNTYLWALALRSERAAQIIHLAWGLLSVLLLWHWAIKIWNVEIGRKTLLLIAAIPSLPMLASWAYADMALVFYATGTLYMLTLYQSMQSLGWLRVAGLIAGLAMGVKYTSFTIPFTGGLLLLLWGSGRILQGISSAAQFSILALVAALPWYVRNAIIMQNPFYPFIFGGRYWDSFLSDWYASAGTGIGWNAFQLLLLPLNIVLGHQDATFYDGRIGPLLLVLAPLAIWILLSGSNQESNRGLSLQIIGLFAALGFAAWTYGVINSSALWQARLLLPALIPFAIPAALGWDSLTQLDTSKLKSSFLINTLIAIVITLTIFDNTVFVLQRNPLAVALGAQSRDGYMARINPPYAALMQMMDDLPADARVYSLFEPRSYGLPRLTQPDAINYNFAHDLYLYRTPSEIIQHWKTKGYTHILLYERGLSFLAQSSSRKLTSAAQATLRETLAELEVRDRSPDKAYTIYRIP